MALQLDSTNESARYHFARLNSLSKRIKDIKNSIKHLSVIIDAYNEKKRSTSEMKSEVFLLRGKLFFGIKLYRKALDDFETAIAIDPTNIENLVSYGSVLTTNGQLTEAKLYIEEAITKNSKYYKAYYYLGYIYMLQKKRRLSQKYFEISLKGNTKEYSEVHKKLGYIYRDMGMKKLAIRELKRYIKMVPAAHDVKDVKNTISLLK